MGAHVRPCPDSDKLFDVCYLYPPEWGEWYTEFRLIFRFIIYFLLPVVIIAALYGAIATVLLRQTSGVGGRSRLSSTTGMARQISSRKRVAKVN